MCSKHLIFHFIFCLKNPKLTPKFCNLLTTYITIRNKSIKLPRIPRDKIWKNISINTSFWKSNFSLFRNILYFAIPWKIFIVVLKVLDYVTSGHIRVKIWSLDGLCVCLWVCGVCVGLCLCGLSVYAWVTLWVGVNPWLSVYGF